MVAAGGCFYTAAERVASGPMPDVRAVVDEYLRSLPDADWRQVAAGEWGLTVESGGWPLHVGIAFRDGLFRAQAEVVGAGQLDPDQLLSWNRQIPMVRFAHTRAGEVWLHVDLPPLAVTPRELDRVLGLLVRVAGEARELAAATSGAPAVE
jgi:hypothetical protein